MKIIRENENYVLAIGIGQYWNTRYEILKKSYYYHYETMEKLLTYGLDFHTSNRIDLLIEAWNKRTNENLTENDILVLTNEIKYDNV